MQPSLQGLWSVEVERTLWVSYAFQSTKRCLPRFILQSRSGTLTSRSTTSHRAYFHGRFWATIALPIRERIQGIEQMDTNEKRGRLSLRISTDWKPLRAFRWQLGTSKIDWFSSIGRRRSQAFCFHFTTKKVERSPLPRTFLSWRAPADREFNTWRGASFGIARRAILMIRGRSHLLYYIGESSFWTSMLPH